MTIDSTASPVREELPIERRTAPIELSSELVPHPRPFICDVRVHESQISPVIPHVANTEYVRWLDRAAELHADHVGYSRRRLLDDNVMWFVARHEIDYLSEIWPDDKLVLATWVRNIRRVKSWRDFVIVRLPDHEPVCRASTLWVLVDLDKRRPRTIDPRMADTFDPLVTPDRRTD